MSADQLGAEIAPIGPHPRFPGRNALGHFATENDGHTSIGVFSEKRWNALQPMLHEERVGILHDKGFTEGDADHVFVRVIDGFNQAVVMMNSYFDFLMKSGGPISAKGRTRRAVEGWSRAADRVARFAQMIGLEKCARRVHQSPVEWLESLDANEQQEGTKDEHEPDSHDATGQTAQRNEQTQREE